MLDILVNEHEESNLKVARKSWNRSNKEYGRKISQTGVYFFQDLLILLHYKYTQPMKGRHHGFSDEERNLNLEIGR